MTNNNYMTVQNLIDLLEQCEDKATKPIYVHVGDITQVHEDINDFYEIDELNDRVDINI